MFAIMLCQIYLQQFDSGLFILIGIKRQIQAVIPSYKIVFNVIFQDYPIISIIYNGICFNQKLFGRALHHSRSHFAAARAHRHFFQ